MTEHQVFEQLIREVVKELESEPNPDDIKLVRRFFDAGVAIGRKLEREDRE